MKKNKNEKNIYVTRSSLPPINEYIKEIEDIWETHSLTNKGAKYQELTKELINFLDTPNISLFTNGHLALEVLIEAMDLKGEVITTPFTFSSTTHAIVRNGLTPVFCDINIHDYTIDANKIEALITEKTSAIIPVHVYGYLCDVEAIEKIANKYNLKVIYDAAHTFAETYQGKNVSNFGDASMFSFHATKTFHTIEGGAIATEDENLAKELDLLKNFGIASQSSVPRVGTNAKMNEFQAAMGLCNLRHLEEEISKRKIAYDRYNERLQNVDGIILTYFAEGIKPNYSYFPIRFDGFKSRDEIFDQLKAHNIFARKYFYPLVSSYECYFDLYDPNDTPIAKHVAQTILTLPLFANLTIEEVDRICDIILE